MERSSGILMPISSLPGKYGIGSIGKSAYQFADFLKKAGQKYWQILPVGPTSYGDSPYQSFSSNAGNPYFIDLDILIDRELLLSSEIEIKTEAADAAIDYGYLYETRFDLLRKAADRAYKSEKDEINDFQNRERWVDGYAKFMALKRANGEKALSEWEIKTYDPAYRADYDLFVYIQYEFYRQWKEFKKYVNSRGIRLIGDIPIYVSGDSADVWLEPEQFELDSDNRPVVVSGVPPDYFSETGQLWGNPIYNYREMEEDGYNWWIRRIGQTRKLVDVIRIDHFRGFSSYWAVPAGEKTAVNGEWRTGPGVELVSRLINWFKDVEFIAEDLGTLTPDVEVMLRDSRLPGMKVLQFAFTGDPDNAYLPHNYAVNSVCYTGTHDNDTLVSWIEKNPEQVEIAKKYLGLNEEEGYARGILRAGMSSISKLFVAPMADWLGLGEEGRINTPGTASGNWTWRMKEGAANDELAETILEFTTRYGRN